MNGKPNGQYYGRTLISKALLENILEQHAALVEDPFHNEVLKNHEMEVLFQESNIDSARLEADLMKGPVGDKVYCGRVSRKILEAEARKIHTQVMEAWTLGCNQYTGNVTEELILNTGKILDPVSNSTGQLRNISGRIASDLSLINPAKLFSSPDYEGYLNRFLREVNTNQVFYSRNDERAEPLTCIEKALYSHFMVFYLQPNNDANKRTGRIIQNLILRDCDCPPPIIHDIENGEYTDKMVEAYRARRTREGNSLPNVLISNAEHELFDYLGKKVLISLQSLNDKLASKKTFYVHIDYPSNSHPAYISAKNALASLLHKRDSSGVSRFVPEEDHLCVRGNITLNEVEAVLDSLNPQMRYTITPKRKNS
jgi:hypothetical protein